MKLLYETPELASERESHDLGSQVTSDLQDIVGSYGERLEALVSRQSVGADRKYVLTLRGLHPQVQVETSFLPTELQNKRRVKYRVSKAYADLLRASAMQST